MLSFDYLSLHQMLLVDINHKPSGREKILQAGFDYLAEGRTDLTAEALSQKAGFRSKGAFTYHWPTPNSYEKFVHDLFNLMATNFTSRIYRKKSIKSLKGLKEDAEQYVPFYRAYYHLKTTSGGMIHSDKFIWFERSVAAQADIGELKRILKKDISVITWVMLFSGLCHQLATQQNNTTELIEEYFRLLVCSR